MERHEEGPAVTRPELPYDEWKAYQEILKWDQVAPSTVDTAGSLFSRAVTRAVGSLVPDSIAQGAIEVIQGGLNKIQDLSLVRASRQELMDHARKHGYILRSLGEVEELTMEQRDHLSQGYISGGTTLSVLQGAGLGAGGAALVLADLPLLISLNLRMLCQLSCLYGFNPEDFRERQYMLELLGLDYAEHGSKLGRLPDMSTVTVQIVKSMPVSQMKKNLLLEVVQRVGRTMGVRLSKSKMLQIVPLVGAFVGAGVNHQFTSRNASTGFMAYRARYLARRYGVFNKS